MKKIIINHKSNLSFKEIAKYKEELEKLNIKNFEIVLFPSIIYLSMFKNYKYEIGTQNFYGEKNGDVTGEINLESLKDLGINYTLINHPERKINCIDSKEMVKEKLNKSLKNNFKTILMVGEDKYIKEPFNYVKKELDYFLKDIKKIEGLSILYEPSWLGETSCDVGNIRKMVVDIKEYFISKYKKEVDVYYAGGVDEKNIESILEFTDGVGIGNIGTSIKKITMLENKFDK